MTTPHIRPTARTEAWKTVTAALIIVIALVLTAQVLLRHLERHAAGPLIQVVITGTTLAIPEHEAPAFRTDLDHRFGRHYRALADELDEHIAREVDALFATPLQRVPDFVSWHYTMTASALRVGTLFGDNMEDFFVGQVERRLLEGDRFGQNLQALTERLDATALAGLGAIRPRVEHELLQAYRDSAVPPTDDKTAAKPSAFDLSHTLQNTFTATTADHGRWRISLGGASLATGMAGTAVLAGRVVRSSRILQHAVAQGWRAAARMVGRRAGSAAMTGTTAGAASAPTGPGALLIGTGVFITTFVGTEYGVLRYQEWRHGPAMEEELQTLLEEAREDLKAQLTAHYRRALQADLTERLAALDARLAEHDTGRRFRVLGRGEE